MVDEWFWQPPTEEQIDRWKGAKTASDFPEPIVEIWDENFDQAAWFRSLLTQFTPQGGFNYSVAYQDFKDMGLAGDVLDEWKWKMKIMEDQCIKNINKGA